LFLKFCYLKYGWAHQEAGKKVFQKHEMSFRQTIHGLSPSDRGFQVIIDRKNSKVLISFDSSKVSDKHSEWLKQVQNKVLA
jgi:hypothetical protein